ncbi:hypothetical protein Pan44_09100 [Caulifigura coniformis]|uniref:Uncharacterized protein n=1 Tax=Caulifigura coniformis TaxID=2527983 RepID=A0A517S9T8_9PLAN|nr:hypothetical protein [Caulifigura coniformis]QDT52897.1 hypothetical protein Pan44_09100 [Caulifigura coniformis]
MTGYTVHTGASKKFATGWDRVFGKAVKKTAATGPKAAKKPAAKKSRSK